MQSGRPDSNRGPHRPERCALPGCATPRRRAEYPTATGPLPCGARWRCSEIVAELDRLLDPERFDDHGPNGLQVQGCDEVEHVATGVSASLELFERAIAPGRS